MNNFNFLKCFFFFSWWHPCNSSLESCCFLQLQLWSFPPVMQWFPRSHRVSVFRCGTTLLPRQPRAGLTPACGSTGRLTSSGSWVRTSPSGQAGEWPLTLLPPHICCSSQGWLSFPPSAVMVIGFAAPFCVFSLNHLFLSFFFVAPMTLQINRNCVFSHDPWGQRCISLVGLSWLPARKRGAL